MTPYAHRPRLIALAVERLERCFNASDTPACAAPTTTAARTSLERLRPGRCGSTRRRGLAARCLCGQLCAASLGARAVPGGGGVHVHEPASIFGTPKLVGGNANMRGLVHRRQNHRSIQVVAKGRGPRTSNASSGEPESGNTTGASRFRIRSLHRAGVAAIDRTRTVFHHLTRSMVEAGSQVDATCAAAVVRRPLMSTSVPGALRPRRPSPTLAPPPGHGTARQLRQQVTRRGRTGALEPGCGPTSEPARRLEVSARVGGSGREDPGGGTRAAIPIA